MQVELLSRNFFLKLASLLVVILTFSAPFSTVAYSATSQQQLDSINQQINNNRQKMKSNNLTKSQLNSDIKTLDSNMYAIQTRIDQLQNQLKGTKAKMSSTQAELDRLQTELNRKQKELDTALKEMKRLSVILNKRASNFYKSGSVSYLEVILSAKSFTDLLHQVDYLSRIVNQDASLVKQIKDTKATIVLAKTAIEKNKATTEQKQSVLMTEENHISSLSSDQQMQKDSLTAQLGKEQGLIASIIGQNKQLADDLSNKENDAAALSQQINSIGMGSPGNGSYTPVVGIPSMSGFIWPVNPHPIVSGWRTPSRPNHAGIDIGIPVGTPIVAVKAGSVSVRLNPGGYGLYIDVDHGGGWVTRYAHLSKIVVGGGAVAQGQLIAYSGGDPSDQPNAGDATGPHLHFEIRIDGGGFYAPGTVNPLNYLP